VAIDFVVMKIQEAAKAMDDKKDLDVNNASLLVSKI
jgi:hypothetical protein